MRPSIEIRIILSAILLFLAGCRDLSSQEVTRLLAPTREETPIVAASATPVPTPSGTPTVVPSPTPVPTPSETPTAVPSPTPAGDPLASTKWFLFSLHGEPTLPGTHITLEFYDGFMRGSAGCNKYDSKMVIGIGADAEVRGKYKATWDGSLETPGYSITLVACPEGVMDQEKAYLHALHSAATFQLVEDRLELQNDAGETILVYTRRAQPTGRPARLEGTAWQLASVDGRAPVGGSATTLAFLDEKWLVEHSKCTGSVSSYQTTGHELRIVVWWSLWRICQDEGGPGSTLFWGEGSDYDLVQGQLKVTTLSGTVFLYDPLPEAAQPALEGPTWSMLAIVAEGSEITLTLKDGRASGSAGCNSYEVAYTLDEALLVFAEVSATEQDCSTPERVMEQEQRYLAALKDVTGYRIVGRQLWLFTDDGPALAFTRRGTDR